MSSIETKIVEFFSSFSNLIFISLFGSYAENRAKVDSDVDVAILFEEPHVPDSLALMDVKENLSAFLEKEVDLICLNSASPILAMQVHIHGKALQVKHPKKYAEYQMRLFIDYAELKEVRAPMEKNILKRKMYGS